MTGHDQSEDPFERSFAHRVTRSALLPRSSVPSSSALESSGAFDVIIKNGDILDGTGSPWYAADIGIRGDRIAAIGKLDSASSAKVIDAQGQIVSPGFIDMLRPVRNVVAHRQSLA